MTKWLDKIIHAMQFRFKGCGSQSRGTFTDDPVRINIANGSKLKRNSRIYMKRDLSR